LQSCAASLAFVPSFRISALWGGVDLFFCISGDAAIRSISNGLPPGL
jgi:peptidoglycan/LPS O-acetylase OafA/YrhL